jgi:ATP-dependent RNA helicase DeaD
MENSFIDLGISPPILKALEEMGFEKPTEVQSKAIPHILKHEDLIVMSKTGSGKTAVFGVSMLQMIEPNDKGPQGLILTPTRELAVQVDNELKKMSKHLKHRTTAVYGQHSMNLELQALSQSISIVTGTPGRVFDHINHGNLVTKNIRFLVLDEADRMLDMGFLDQVVKIIKTLPKDRVTLLFSATIPPKIRRICKEYMKQPVTIEIKSQTKTVDTIEQKYYRVDGKQKNTELNHILLIERPESCMIFCNTRNTVDKVQRFLSQKGYACEALHGEIPQGKRMKTIMLFKQGKFHILVATDVAARGIHIDNLSLVINYDVPVEKDSYVHRIGRTGRAGNSGKSLTFVTSEDIMTLYSIEEHIGAMITEGELPTEEMYLSQKAEADKWVRANAIQVKAPRVESEVYHKKAGQGRSSYGKAQGRSHQSRDSLSRGGQSKTLQNRDSLNRGAHSKASQNMDYQNRGAHSKTSQNRDYQYRNPQSKNRAAHNDSRKDVRRGHQESVVAPRSVNTARKTAAGASKGGSSGVKSKNTEVVQSQKSAPKISLIKRIFQKLLGK